ncbi:hypothetical protein SAMN06265222_112117 [Neorhodopirellula lusitana]|uniref:AsmA-like C-terminal domain-containing protein n=1 Tax=Neorhodopirellula lusitana TaxID=445327 RepID=A0ABY1QHN0_9BACT|nr:hypothetical protein [Neorhodopirellula lusitana]SMP69867.1 hypothetical protein SAMN06265222_112117 [Neorhodopirellula lusitana]
MHERTTRAIARWMFVACCAVPTGLTLLAIVITWTPWYHNHARHSVEDALALQTGLHVEIGDFERADPTTWRLYDVRLANAETLRTVATVRSLVWVADSENTVIRLSQPEIQVHALDQIADLIHDRFLCRPERTGVPVRIAADDLTLKSATTAQTLQDFDAYLETRDSVVWATVRCLPAGQRPDSDGLKAEITRDRSASPPRTSYSLQTGELSLPVAVLADYFPFLGRMGDEATFQGTAASTKQDGYAHAQWSLDLSGRFRSVDLGRLTEQLPHRVTGLASVTLDRCQIDGEGGVNISGELRSSEGWMSASLLPRVAEDLGCELTIATANDFSFDALAFRFDLYAAQLRVEGICRTQPGSEWLPAGVVVSSAGRPVVLSRDAWLPATNLARLVAPPHAVAIPLSSQTSGLLSILKPPRHSLPSLSPGASDVYQNGLVDGSGADGRSGEGSSGAMNGNATVLQGDPASLRSGVIDPNTINRNAVDPAAMEPAARIGRVQPWGNTPQSVSQPY